MHKGAEEICKVLAVCVGPGEPCESRVEPSRAGASLSQSLSLSLPLPLPLSLPPFLSLSRSLPLPLPGEGGEVAHVTVAERGAGRSEKGQSVTGWAEAGPSRC